MKSIEERAKDYSATQAIQSYSYCGYFHGATEQREIDIQKAIEVHCKFCTMPKDDSGVCYYMLRGGRCMTKENFRKAMEGD